MTSVIVSCGLQPASVPNYNIPLRICVHFPLYLLEFFSKVYFCFRHFPYFCHIYPLYYSHKMKEQQDTRYKTQRSFIRMPVPRNAQPYNEPGSRLSASLWPPGSTNKNLGKPGMTYIVVQLHIQPLHPPFSICEENLCPSRQGFSSF